MIHEHGATRAPRFEPQVRRVKAGAVLMIIGGLLGAVGSLMASIELAAATRRWVQGQDQPPAEIARVRLRQAVAAGQAATRAAADSWAHDGSGEHVSAFDVSRHHAE